MVEDDGVDENTVVEVRRAISLAARSFVGHG